LIGHAASQIDRVVGHGLEEYAGQTGVLQQYPGSIAEQLAHELEIILQRGPETEEPHSGIRPQVNNAVDETTDLAHVLHEAAQVFMLASEQRLNEQIGHFRRQAADGFSLLDVSRHRGGRSLAHNSPVQFIELRQYRRVSFETDVPLEDFSYQSGV
jgi:hypothetical protein